MTDYEDFKKFSGTASPKTTPEEVLTIGLRSDGSVCIMSGPGLPGPQPAHSFIMSRDAARWVARELLRVTELPSEVKP